MLPSLPAVMRICSKKAAALPRPEKLAPIMIPPSVKRDVRRFRPNIFHVASPELLGHRAVTLAGDEVVVKVQRPEISHRIDSDLTVLRSLARRG